MSLRELVAEGPLDSVRATSVAHAIASAVSAAHATGMAHGNVHPGSVLIGDDGRVVLTDARADDSVTPERDVRAVGAVLYCALTGHWPHAEAGRDSLPDGMRDSNGVLASPRQMRGGLPSFLSELATDLLNPRVPAPSSESLAQELSRLDTGDNDDLFGDSGALGFTSVSSALRPESRSRNGRKFAVGVAALLAVAAAGLIIASNIGGKRGTSTATTPTPDATTASHQPVTHSATLPISSVRIVDPKGDGQELDGADKMIDGDQDTDWHTAWYRATDFGGGNYKPGMGVLVDLGKSVDVTSIKIDFDSPGSTVDTRVGNTDPGSGHSGDATVVSSYAKVGSAVSDAPSTTVLPIGVKARYVLIWITKLPPVSAGRFQVGIDEITVAGS